MNSQEILDEEFLTLRAKVLDIAAALDRIQRADGDVADDVRKQQIATAVEILGEDQPGRASRIQLLFSRKYDASWKTQFELPTRE